MMVLCCVSDIAALAVQAPTEPFILFCSSNSLCISSVDLNELSSDPHTSPFRGHDLEFVSILLLLYLAEISLLRLSPDSSKWHFSKIFESDPSKLSILFCLSPCVVMLSMQMTVTLFCFSTSYNTYFGILLYIFRVTGASKSQAFL